MTDTGPDILPDIRLREHVLQQIQTADSVFLPREVFEALYLNPERKVAGDLREKFGNPTPAALIGFVIAATPYSIACMGWRGAGGQGGAIIPTLIFFGGMLQLVSAVMEWVLGNTFSMCLFFTFGTFLLVTGTQNIPFFATGLQYSTTGNTLQGQTEPAYFATFGFFYLSLAVVTVIFTICALRTNVVFVAVLFLLSFTFATGAGAYFEFALGNIQAAERLVVTVGALAFTFTAMVWYLLVVQLFASVDFPLTLPVGDLQGFIKGKREKLANRAHMSKQETAT